MAKITISIPKPCSENWETMTPEDKGRFCASCQKKVHDFTKASDREIVTAFQQNQNLCGRFLDTQLNRDLIKPEKKSTIWLAASATVIGLLGTKEIAAQEPVKTEQTDYRILLGKPVQPKPANEEIKVTGIITDSIGPVPGTTIHVRGTNKYTQAGLDGKYTIYVRKGEKLVFSFIGYKDQEVTISESTTIVNIAMKNANIVLEGMMITEKKRTFFGRIFHRIGNLFRK